MIGYHKSRDLFQPIDQKRAGEMTTPTLFTFLVNSARPVNSDACFGVPGSILYLEVVYLKQDFAAVLME